MCQGAGGGVRPVPGAAVQLHGLHHAQHEPRRIRVHALPGQVAAYLDIYNTLSTLSTISTPGCGARPGPATPATAAAARTPTGTGATTGASRVRAPTPATVRDTFILLVSSVDYFSSYFPETYRGSQAFSEPETRAVRDFIMARRSDIKLYLTFHRCVDSRYLDIYVDSRYLDIVSTLSSSAATARCSSTPGATTGWTTARSGRWRGSAGSASRYTNTF